MDKRLSDAPIVIEEIAHHRNGVTGESFHVVRFLDPSEETRMVATVFPRRKHVAVFALGALAQGIIAFGENSWRGDHYEGELRAAIKAWDALSYEEQQALREEAEDDADMRGCGVDGE